MENGFLQVHTYTDSNVKGFYLYTCKLHIHTHLHCHGKNIHQHTSNFTFENFYRFSPSASPDYFKQSIQSKILYQISNRVISGKVFHNNFFYYLHLIIVNELVQCIISSLYVCIHSERERTQMRLVCREAENPI